MVILWRLYLKSETLCLTISVKFLFHLLFFQLNRLCLCIFLHVNECIRKEIYTHAYAYIYLYPPPYRYINMNNSAEKKTFSCGNYRTNSFSFDMSPKDGRYHFAYSFL